MNVKLLKNSQYQMMPWKNGLGMTAQIDIFPEGATFPSDEFLWRISSATVATSSTFSAFVGCDRWLVAWKGAGLILNDVPLLPQQPLHFAGEEHIHCRLKNEEPVVDVGLIYRRDRIEASLQVQYLKKTSTEILCLNSEVAYLFCTQGAFSVAGNFVEAGDTVKLIGGGDIEMTTMDGACFFVFKLRMKNKETLRHY